MSLTTQDLEELSAMVIEDMPKVPVEALIRGLGGCTEDEIDIMAKYICKNYTAEEILDAF